MGVGRGKPTTRSGQLPGRQGRPGRSPPVHRGLRKPLCAPVWMSGDPPRQPPEPRKGPSPSHCGPSHTTLCGCGRAGGLALALESRAAGEAAPWTFRLKES